MTALSSHPAQVLEELNLGYNSIGDKSIEYIAEYIKVYVCTTIDTCVCIYTTYKIHSCFFVQTENCPLKTLDLSYTDIGPEGAEKLANALQVQT